MQAFDQHQHDSRVIPKRLVVDPVPPRVNRRYLDPFNVLSLVNTFFVGIAAQFDRNKNEKVMDLSEIPFDVPVVLQSVSIQKNLQNPLGSKKARCLTDNGDVYEQLILHRVSDDKVAIESARNGRFLQVRASGGCVFDLKQPGEWELFTMETDVNCALYFVSCHTGNVLQCDGYNVVKCANQHRQRYEAWRIAEPRAPSTVATQVQRVSDPRYVLSGKDGLNLVMELVKGGETPKEIVMKMFDAPDGSASSSAMAVSVSQE